jgi:hypothetical protein
MGCHMGLIGLAAVLWVLSFSFINAAPPHFLYHGATVTKDNIILFV